MKTRSRKGFATKSDITDAGGHSSTQKKGPSIQWDCADIDHMEFDESASTYHVFLKWPNGDVSEHPRDEIYDKCPQQVVILSLTQASHLLLSLTLLECILTLDWASLDDKVVGKPRGKMLRAAAVVTIVGPAKLSVGSRFAFSRRQEHHGPLSTAPGMNLSILKKFKDIFRCKDSPVFKGHRVALVIQYLVSPPEPRMRQE
ncbi:hypothetical protein DER46DRAFT_517884 [Fusarium sp. MPI-SDFR-AT-0072]|nr:hypothetical protein DER46DRAFT_517884 [Fusarium sp. MPI-SDFR-AT-0072]